jgi:hypothetical protein
MSTVGPLLSIDTRIINTVKPHHFYAAPTPGENFGAAPAAPAPTLLYSKSKFLKGIRVNIMYDILFFQILCKENG